MSLDNITQDLRTALDKLRSEHSRLSRQISAVETALGELGAPAKRGPGRPKGTARVAAPAVKRGPGRPKGSKNKKAVAAKSSAGGGAAGKRRKPNWSNEAREAARARMRAYWAQRRKG